MTQLSFKTITLAALVAVGNASPFVYPRATGSNSTYVFTNSHGLNFTQMNTTLPNVTILATGGTIAGSSDDNTATTGYTAGAIGIQQLMDAVPEMLDVANVAGIQVANVGSPDVTSSLLLRMAKTIKEVVCDDPTMSGAVITHGTDTLEETAFFLDATVNCGKPIVVVGAMRPATAISADGPFNLLQAVTVAVHQPRRAGRPERPHRLRVLCLQDKRQHRGHLQGRRDGQPRRHRLQQAVLLLPARHTHR
jgi:L-asparaginase